MHRKTFPPRFLAWSLALGFLINFLAQAVTAQGVDRQLPGFAQQPNIADGKVAAKDATEPYILVLSKDSTRQIEMSTKELISEFRSENPTVVKVQALLDNPRAVLVTGVNPGSTRIFLTDVKKNVESMEVRVLRGDEEQAVEAAAARKRETEARLAADRQESVVKTRHLLDLIRKNVPTANVEVEATKNIFQGGSSLVTRVNVINFVAKKWTVVLSGTVPLAESIPVITNLALGVFEDSEVINNMVIPRVQQVQIEVTIARVNRSRARNIGFSFLEAGKQHFLASTVGGAGSLSTFAGLPSVLSPVTSLTSNPNAVFGIFNDKQSFTGLLERPYDGRACQAHFRAARDDAKRPARQNRVWWTNRPSLRRPASGRQASPTSPSARWSASCRLSWAMAEFTLKSTHLLAPSIRLPALTFRAPL